MGGEVGAKKTQKKNNQPQITELALIVQDVDTGCKKVTNNK